LVVGIEPGTYMIKVTLQSPDRNEPDQRQLEFPSNDN